MKLYYRDDTVIATHSDDQIIDPSVYGSNVSVMFVSDDIILEKKGILNNKSFLNGITIDSRPFKVPKIIEVPLTKDETKAKIVEIINNFSNRYTSKYPTSEMLSWGTKDLAARTFLAGETISESQRILLDTEKTIGNYDSIEDLCKVIINNSDVFIKISGFIAGLRVSSFTNIDKANSNQELKNIIENANKIISETFP